MEKIIAKLPVKRQSLFFSATITDDVQKLLDLRKNARNEKNWPESDRLRDEIKKLGWDVEDTKSGQIITRVTSKT